MRDNTSLVAAVLRMLALQTALIACVVPTKTYADSWASDAQSSLKNGPIHYQLKGAFTSETDFGPAMLFAFERSPEKTRAYAISAGRKLSDTVFGWPVETLGYVGWQQFDERGLQRDAYGFSAFVKFHTSLNLPFTNVPVRLGFGPGLS